MQDFTASWSCRRPLPSTQNSRVSEGKQVVIINQVVCTNCLGTECHAFSPGMVGPFPKSRFTDASQGPSLQADLSKNNSLVSARHPELEGKNKILRHCSTNRTENPGEDFWFRKMMAQTPTLLLLHFRSLSKNVGRKYRREWIYRGTDSGRGSIRRPGCLTNLWRVESRWDGIDGST